MTRTGKRHKPASNGGTPASRRPGSLGTISLFPGMESETPDAKAEAFIGRMMRVEDGEAYDLIVQPYCESTNGYDLANRAIKNMYIKYVVNAGWDEGLFLHVLSWVMTNRMQVDSFSFDKACRLNERGRLPLGSLRDLSVDAYNKIVLH